MLAGTARGQDFGPRYLIERVEISGNRKTARRMIERELLVRAGDVVGADDERVVASRFRVLALGYFTDVTLQLRRGQTRGTAVLLVAVAERPTLVLNQIFLGTSEAVPLWGGVDVSESNLGGRGITVGGAFLLAMRSQVLEGRTQHAYRLRLAIPRLGQTPLSVAATGLYNDASEPFRTSGSASDGAPDNFTAVPYTRLGAIVSVGIELGAALRLGVDYRLERVHADLPDALIYTAPDDGRTHRVDVGLLPDASTDSTLSLILEYDTRNDPALPTSGTRFAVVGELGSRVIASSYEFYKLTLSYQAFWPLRWGHVISPQAMGGVIVGDAPIFDRFYVGDIDPLIPPRALGLTFSTQPARNLLGAGMAGERYGVLAGRAGIEYIWPLFRGGQYFYGGHLFAGAGVIALASRDDLRLRDGSSLYGSLPVDLWFDAGLRLDTFLGIFHFSIGNFIGRLPL